MRTLLTTLVLLLATESFLTANSENAEELERQRRVFQEVYADAELGIWASAETHRALLEDYVLWPDLRAVYLQKTLGQDNDRDVRAFLQQYGDLKPARTLRYRYTLHLARQGRYDEFQLYFQQHYADLGVARLDCLNLQTQLETLEPSALLAAAKPLWLVGHSQADECDPVFRRLRESGRLGKDLYAKRYALAIEARQLSMARYLARQLDPTVQQEAQRWSQVYSRPQRFLEQHSGLPDGALLRRQLQVAIEQIAYTDPQLAETFWQKIRDHFEFDAAERAAMARHIVLWLARHHIDGAYDRLVDLQDDAVDTEVRRWRIRSALRERDFAKALQHIDEMSEPERSKPQWRYWRGVSMQQAGDSSASEIFAALAEERSYYGFLAADAIAADYNFSHEALTTDDAALQLLEKNPALIRARELFMVGLDGRGRSEWDSVMRTLSEEQQLQAAQLAHRWGWHSRAIATTASNEHYDDLDIRYPLPYTEDFSRSAAAANIRTSWAFGIARSESLFMRDIRSSAGAIGLMQLMPDTGRRTAREINEPWIGYKTLTDPQSNIRLGTWFLGQMQARFNDNPVLATAAYNAGAQRVDAWLPRTQALDARIWIETIPYSETRDYVRRVMTAEAIFNWRMDGSLLRLSERLQDVPPAAVIRQVAANP